MDNEFIFLVLLPASLFDLSRYRIPNAVSVAGLIISLIRHLELQGLNGVSPWLAGMIVPLLLFFFLFRWRFFGASDGKILAVAGSYVGVPGVFFVLFFSLLAGAFLSIIKMVINHNVGERFSYLIRYIKMTSETGKLEPYYSGKRIGREAVIPYGVAVGFGTLFYGLI
ncbi:MAG: prepilin peptidase [Eubacterium sp.]|nr:prepilin peptidase [Eubacterium sp.]